MAKIYNTRNYKNGQSLVNLIARDINQIAKNAITKVSNEIFKIMQVKIDEFYLYSTLNNIEYENTGEFGNALKMSAPYKRKNAWSVKMWFDPSEIRTVVQDSGNGKTIGTYWGVHNEYSDMNSFFLTLDENGWVFPSVNRSDGGDRPPAGTVDAALNYIRSSAFDGTIISFFKSNGITKIKKNVRW